MSAPDFRATYPSRPTLPTYTCTHKHLPLPLHAPYPPPANYPFPCRSCHYTTCAQEEQRLNEACARTLRNMEARIRIYDEQLWFQYERVKADAREEARRIRDGAEAERVRGLRRVWAGFGERWGGPCW